MISLVCLFEEKLNYNELPKDLLNFLSTPEGKGHWNGNIKFLHNFAIKEISLTVKDILDSSNDQNYINMVKSYKDFIKQKQLICIYYDFDGDFYFYSFNDKNIYCWNHEEGLFRAIDPNNKDQQVISYREWIRKIKI